MEKIKKNIRKNIGTWRTLLVLPFALTFMLLGIIIFGMVAIVTWFIINNTFLNILLLVILVLCFELHLRKKHKYYSYKISSEEYNELSKTRLIHYTNSMTEQDYLYYLETGLVRIKAKKSAGANYVMKFKDKRNPYIWFHQEEQNGEPSFDSFIFTHNHENKARKYKVILELNKITQDRILLRPDNRNIIIEGDLEIPGIVETEFEFYNKNLYLKHLIKGNLSFLNAISHVYYGTHIIYGKLLDTISKYTATKRNDKEQIEL